MVIISYLSLYNCQGRRAPEPRDAFSWTERFAALPGGQERPNDRRGSTPSQIRSPHTRPPLSYTDVGTYVNTSASPLHDPGLCLRLRLHTFAEVRGEPHFPVGALLSPTSPSCAWSWPAFSGCVTHAPQGPWLACQMLPTFS